VSQPVSALFETYSPLLDCKKDILLNLIEYLNQTENMKKQAGNQWNKVNRISQYLMQELRYPRVIIERDSDMS